MRQRINALAAARRIPVLSTVDAFTREGGLLSLGTSYQHIYRRAAVYVDKILKGTKPSDLPIERPTMFNMMINLKAAKLLGIECWSMEQTTYRPASRASLRRV